MASIAQIMNKKPQSIGPTTSIRGAAKKMRDLRVGSLLIKKGKNFVGIVTDTDLVRKGLATSQDVSKLTVEKIMTTPLCTIESNQAVDEAQDMMGDLGVRLALLAQHQHLPTQLQANLCRGAAAIRLLRHAALSQHHHRMSNGLPPG